MQNVLFVCSRNQWRSPTAENIFKNTPDLNVRSGGTSSKAKHKVSAKDIGWADIIFVMEKKHKQILTQHHRDVLENKKIVILDIPDDFKFMDTDLINLLQLSVNPYLKL